MVRNTLVWGQMGVRMNLLGLDTPKMKGGVKILNFQGALKLTPFYRNSRENRQLGVKSPSLQGPTFGASSPPSWSPIRGSIEPFDLLKGSIELFGGGRQF